MRHWLAALVVTACGPVEAEAPLDGARPLDTDEVCLARTVYFEARGLPERDLAAVAHVVLNRVRHRDYPGTVCAVVREGGETPPCQFSWWCDGRSDRPRDRAEYARAVSVARAVLAGGTADPTGGAILFHNDRVRPAWARVARRTARIGPHTFYYLERR